MLPLKQAACPNFSPRTLHDDLKAHNSTDRDHRRRRLFGNRNDVSSVSGAAADPVGAVCAVAKAYKDMHPCVGPRYTILSATMSSPIAAPVSTPVSTLTIAFDGSFCDVNCMFA